MTKHQFNRITHFIPPENFQKLQKEFVEPNSSDHFIYFLFSYRCINCKRPATEINEIKPRGRSKKNILDWKNRVPMCRECHTNFHKDGVTDAKIIATKMLREQFLISARREKYV